MSEWDALDTRLLQMLARAYYEGYASGVEDAPTGEFGTDNPYARYERGYQ